MFKKKKSLAILFLLLIGAGLGLGRFFYHQAQARAFLKTLKGEVVFSRRDHKGILNIWKIKANGEGEKLLYRNEDRASSYLPEWSSNGMGIFFTIAKDGMAKKALIDINGTKVQILEEPGFYLARDSREKDIVVKKGSVYWQDEEGKLHLVYFFPGHNYKTNPGASEASWSPDKKYIIFQSCSFFRGCQILIADKEGRRARLTKGQEPDWRY